MKFNRRSYQTKRTIFIYKSSLIYHQDTLQFEWDF
jgi:hypothetical protein